MAMAFLGRTLLTKQTLTLIFSRTFTAPSLSVCRFALASRSSFHLLRLRPLVALTEFRHFQPEIGLQCFATLQTSSSSLNDPNPNCTYRPPRETIVLEGCDYEHWLVLMEKPVGEPERDELINSYFKTLATVLGSEDGGYVALYVNCSANRYHVQMRQNTEWMLPPNNLRIVVEIQIIFFFEEESRKSIYSVSTRHYYAFGCIVSEEIACKINELPGVRWALPDSYVDPKNKDYGAIKLLDLLCLLLPLGTFQAVPYDPKYHEEWVRDNNPVPNLGDGPPNRDMQNSMPNMGGMPNRDAERNAGWSNNMPNRDAGPNAGWSNNILNRDAEPNETQQKAGEEVDDVEFKENIRRKRPNPPKTLTVHSFIKKEAIADKLFALYKNENIELDVDEFGQDNSELINMDMDLGEPFIDGKAVPYDPKYHEEWVRNNSPRQKDRPRNFDRSRNFERRENMPKLDFRSREMPPLRNRDMQNSVPNLGGGPPNRDMQNSMPNMGGMPNTDAERNAGWSNNMPNRDAGNMPNRDFQNRDGPYSGGMPNQSREMPSGAMPNRDYQNNYTSNRDMPSGNPLPGTTYPRKRYAPTTNRDYQ
ncbi:hypothetical protein HHK36_003576 [Tetracentron sinense]|uniref:MORF/ORRM1/DAG-like MORF domain-containing protein n=1 Tax=Tetracentron sinense TaxID=13715 RepID=A0A834ZYM6_TETSI|nr:hypothetical protein HHK36_003576 [Tetracentron sinense]